MHERKASAQDCEIQIVRIFKNKQLKCVQNCKQTVNISLIFFQISPIRQVHAISPDESSMGKKYAF